MPFLPRQSEAVVPSAWGQAMRDAELAQPQTSTVTGAFVKEATVGVGTGYADIQALKAETAGGRKLAKEEMTQYEGVSWYEGITDESAKVQKDFNDSAQARAKIISEASTGQTIVGFLAGFGAGVFEPKNAAIGLGVTLAAGPLGTAGYLGNRARLMYNLAKTSTRARVAIGAGEGLAAAALTEPSNRYSAKVLQQDYTMMDSAFNVLTSTAFGAGVPAAAGIARDLSPIIQAKVEKFKGRTMDVVAAEVDLATQQLELGQRVDVSAVEAAQIGKLADAPVTKQVEVIKATNPERLPQPKTFDIPQPPTKEIMDSRARVEPVPIDRIESSQGIREWDKFNKGEFAEPLIDGYGGKPVLAKFKNGDYILFDGNHRTELARQSGANSIDAYVIDVADYAPARDRKLPKESSMSDDDLLRELGIAVEELDTANTATIAQHNTQAIDPRNDTVIDYDAVDAMDERRAIMEAESEVEAEIYFQQAEAEIRQMLDEGTLSEADLEDYRKILEDMNESKKTTDALETLKLCLTGL